MQRFAAGAFAGDLTYGYGLPTRSAHGAVVDMTGSTEARLVRHAQKFEGEEKRQRRTGSTLRAQVLELHSRGMVPAAIADTLNLSDRRVAQILKAA